MKTEASANYFGSFEWEGKQVEFTVKVYGEAFYYPEKRVSGNPTMIESFEESGVDVKDFAVDELTIDGQEAELTKELEDEIMGYLEETSDEIEWEYED